MRREKYFWLLQIAKEGRILRVVISLLAVVFVIALSSLVIEWRVESYVKGYAYSLCNMATTCISSATGDRGDGFKQRRAH